MSVQVIRAPIKIITALGILSRGLWYKEYP